MNKLYLSKESIGGFASAFCWSSSELDSDYAWTQGFGNGTQANSNKSTTNRDRAVRAF